MRPGFVITDPAPDFFVSDLQNLGFNVHFYQPNQTQEYKFEKIEGIVVRRKLKLDAATINSFPNLKYILRPGSGLDIIDLEYAKKRSIKVINSPEGNRDAVAEHTFGLLLGLLNHIPYGFNSLRNFEWKRKECTGIEIKGKNFGIVGFGNMGSALAERLNGFGCNILSYDKFKNNYSPEYVNEVSLNALFEKADFVSYHIPYNKENHYFVNKEHLQQFKKPVYIINTSRGKILNTQHLIEMLNSEQIAGAALDVFENENLDSYTFEEKTIFESLTKSNKVILSPHVAGWTLESDQKIYSVLIEKLKNAL